MQKVILVILVLIIIVGGGWYLYSRSAHQTAATSQSATSTQQASQQTSAGSYPYTCDNGATFTMTPSADVSSITVSADLPGIFSGNATLQRSASSAALFTGTVLNAPVTFKGNGETVTVSVAGEKATCNPVPNSENAPWNWGDA